MELEKFDIEKAKAGRKVVTRSELPVEILKWDARGEEPLVGIILQNEEDTATSWEIDGCYHSATGDNSYDLFLAPEESFVVMNNEGYLSQVFNSLETAIYYAKHFDSRKERTKGIYKLVKV